MGATAERPPPTPCPPRMAVPNSSHQRPASTKCAAGVLPPLAPQVVQPEIAVLEESDDEEEHLVINLADLQGVEGGEEHLSQTLQGPPQDQETQRVVAAISALALHLQRTKANQWNELIQVVLQGPMLAKDSGTSRRGIGAAAAPAAKVR